MSQVLSGSMFNRSSIISPGPVIFAIEPALISLFLITNRMTNVILPTFKTRQRKYQFRTLELCNNLSVTVAFHHRPVAGFHRAQGPVC